MTGGTWDTRSESFQGNIAEQVLRSYDFDQLFIGADGIDLERGTTTFNELVRLSQVMAEVSREVIVMVESQKLAEKMPNVELTWQQIDVLITDNKIISGRQRSHNGARRRSNLCRCGIKCGQKNKTFNFSK